MKVGDIVKIKENLKVKELYGGKTFAIDMKKYCGKQARITCIYTHGYNLDIDGGKWHWTDDMLEPVSKEYKVIVNGNTVIIKDDKGNEGVARCSPEDEFNLSTGISLAIEKLRWKPNHHECYWTIDFSRSDYIRRYIWENDCTDRGFFKNNVVFKTKEEAKEVAEKMLNFIK